MNELYPTKTRLALLQGVADTEVTHRRNWGHDPDEDVWRRDNVNRTVTSRMAELERAGWVKRGAQSGPSIYSPSRWELTDAGRKVLDGAT